MTTESLRVTVIIPSYNRANYLPVAIDSILAQSYPVFEIVVVDDGSTDNTAEVVKAYSNQVSFYERGHQGVSAARNYGLDMAQGDVIAWLDADDVWEPEFLASTVPLLENDPALDGVYTGIAHIDEAGNLLPQSNIRTVPPQQLFSALLEEDFVLTPTVVVRKCCFDQAGRFDEQFHICEDYDMWLRLAKSFTLQGVSQPLVRVRIHSGNTLRDISALVHYRLLVVSKHFGAVDGDPTLWSTEKQMAQAFALRDVAFVEIQAGQTEQGWAHLERAILCWPALLDGPRTFYELALGNQQRGQRGQLDPGQIRRNAADLLQRLGELLDRSGENVKSMRRVAFGNAYVALSMLAEQAGDWHLARSYIFKAVQSNPRLGREPKVVRRLIKTVAGPQAVGRFRRLRGTSSALVHSKESAQQRNNQQA
jgi:tetratricopeptide (TPR) repeat protein